MESILPVHILILAAVIAVLLYVLREHRQKPTMSFLSSWLVQKKPSPESQTPPFRAADMEKKAQNTPKDTLPPSIRPGLAKVAASLPGSQGTKLQSAIDAQQTKLQESVLRDFTDDFVKRHLMPFQEDWTSCSADTYTPTGISLDEVKALGDFPDYATLSGVPEPAAYREFKIDKAIPRPYRPFRWKYHQTMCKFLNQFVETFKIPE